jgi:DNA-binding transcriptional regulator GbsR (MarR family)
MNVVLMDLKILASLSKGLRKAFGPVVRQFFSNVISKFRDKKTQMIDETNKCLDEFYHCINMEEVLDDIK